MELNFLSKFLFQDYKTKLTARKENSFKKKNKLSHDQLFSRFFCGDFFFAQCLQDTFQFFMHRGNLDFLQSANFEMHVTS